jgi:hypothetical protein
MFNVEVNEFSSSTVKLLKNIESLLIEQNTLLKQAFCSSGNLSVEQNKIKNKANIETMGRKEILALIKTLPKKPKGKYMTMNIEELRKAVKEAIQ